MVEAPGVSRAGLSAVAWALFAVSLTALAHAAYIPAKAWLAQRLLAYAWQQRGGAAGPGRPWPGADMRPLARLRQQRLGVDQIVLDGASGRVLAFAPGHVVGSALPGQRGNVVISAHRDTHFRWLAGLRSHDELELEDVDGAVRRYAVEGWSVVHERSAELLDPFAGDGLRLVTCYPFDGVAPGTPWRFVITARPV
ncbi:MAG: class GN sortase [Chromatiaceae bacterium]|nr:class GN sortase [Chromatiaceae bacterium]